MSFELSPEHEDFRKSVREFAEAEIGPHAARWDKEHHFPVETVHQMGQLGLFGLTAPEEFGGAGDDGDFTSLCVAIEEIGRVDQSMGITLRSASASVLSSPSAPTNSGRPGSPTWWQARRWQASA
jgi:short-chain 2-methylacyl-CoA dehydrogenase